MTRQQGDDFLRAEIKTVQDWARQNNVPFIPVSVVEQLSIAVLNFDAPDRDCTRNFLAALAEAGVSLLAASSYELQESDVDAALRGFSEADAADDDCEVRGRIEAARKSVGCVAYLGVWAFLKSAHVVLALDRRTQWHDDVFFINDDDQDKWEDDEGGLSKEEEEAAEERSRQWKDLCRDVADIATKDDRFLLAKNQTQREYVVRDLMRKDPRFKSENDCWDGWDRGVAADAQAVLALDVLPALETKVARLLEDGDDIPAIARAIERSEAVARRIAVKIPKVRRTR